MRRLILAATLEVFGACCCPDVSKPEATASAPSAAKIPEAAAVEPKRITSFADVPLLLRGRVDCHASKYGALEACDVYASAAKEARYAECEHVWSSEMAYLPGDSTYTRVRYLKCVEDKGGWSYFSDATAVPAAMGELLAVVRIIDFGQDNYEPALAKFEQIYGPRHSKRGMMNDASAVKLCEGSTCVDGDAWLSRYFESGEGAGKRSAMAMVLLNLDTVSAYRAVAEEESRAAKAQALDSVK